MVDGSKEIKIKKNEKESKQEWKRQEKEQKAEIES
jgi:hypothetical protein